MDDARWPIVGEGICRFCGQQIVGIRTNPYRLYYYTPNPENGCDPGVCKLSTNGHDPMPAVVRYGGAQWCKFCGATLTGWISPYGTSYTDSLGESTCPKRPYAGRYWHEPNA